jgi:hypothetical protein
MAGCMDGTLANTGVAQRPLEMGLVFVVQCRGVLAKTRAPTRNCSARLTLPNCEVSIPDRSSHYDPARRPFV